MATLAQVQATATAKRAANRATPTTVAPTVSTPTSSGAFDKAAYDGDRIAFYNQQSYAGIPNIAPAPLPRIAAGYNPDGTFYSKVTPVTTARSSSTPQIVSSPLQKPISVTPANIIAPINTSSIIPPDNTGVPTDDEERKRIQAQNKITLATNKARKVAEAKTLADAKVADMEAKKKAEFDATFEGGLLNKQQKITDDQKRDIEDERAAQQAALKPMEALMQEMENETTSIGNEASRYEAEQNDLMQQYEGNRLNQVRGQLMSALSARGVDISKLTPEQILQLSGDVGSKAFTDVFQAKEKTKGNIDARRRDANIRVSALRQQRILTDQQAREKKASIDSLANSQKRAIDDSYSKMFYNVMTTADQNKKAEQQTALANLLAVAKDAGITGNALSSIASIANTSNSSPEALRAFYTSLANPNSLIAQKIAAAESTAMKSALAQAALKQYEAETDRIKANASMTSATRARSSGGGGVVGNGYGTAPASGVSIGNPDA